MTPPTVLLDRPFLEALADPADPLHAEAAACYAQLVDQYEAEEIRLRAREDHLAAIDRAAHGDLVAPVESISVARQFRRQALRLGDGYEPDLAVTLVVMRRESIDRIATFDSYFDTLDDVTVER
jgi:predicted nucleic acid-binding protein